MDEGDFFLVEVEHELAVADVGGSEELEQKLVVAVGLGLADAL